METGKLLTKSGESTFETLKDASVVAYYFSAHWCPPCRRFTPVLADLYKKWNANDKKIEVVFVSFDNDKSQFEEYFGEMPWTALPFGDDRIQKLGDKFGVEGIPSLCIVSKDGKETCLSDNGREDVQLKGEKAIEEWQKLYA